MFMFYVAYGLISVKFMWLIDVKRWLADLRGKDMPDSFSWSCKRLVR